MSSNKLVNTAFLKQNIVLITGVRAIITLGRVGLPNSVSSRHI